MFGYWTKERCREEALKYNSRSEFRNESGGASFKAQRKGWFEEICTHMVRKSKPVGYWTKERCREEALKYNSRSQYRKKCPSYQAAHKNGWIDEICSHMGKKIKTEYIIYAYEFPDNHIYVGLTKNKNRRFNEHLSSRESPVYKHQIKTGLTPKRVILYNQLVFNNNDIKEQEKFWLNDYVENGWIKLNKAKTGAIGVETLIWTKKKCHKVALTCNSRKEFVTKFVSAYDSAHRNGWLDEICSHMELQQKPNGYWTYDRCREAALKCKSVKVFTEKYSSAYTISKNNGWMKEFNKFLINKTINNKKRNYWTKERCREEALKYNSRYKFQKSSNGAYGCAFKNGWLDEICSHMELLIKPNGFWDVFENCKGEALKHKTRSQFYREMPGAYHAATRNGWLDGFFPKYVRN